MMVMSWWIGLSRAELNAQAAARHFKWARNLPLYDPEDLGYRGYKTKGIGREHIRHYNELGFITAPSIDMIHTPPENIGQSEWTDDKRLQQLDAERAYREWRARAYAWPSQLKRIENQTQACDYAATLIVMLRLGRTPTEWTRDMQHEFERWCEEHKEQIAPMLEMTE